MEIKKLFADAQAGDREAFEQLFAQFENDVRGFARARMSRDLAKYVDVDDVIQETSLRAIQSLSRVEWQGPKALSNWFCGIALNVVFTNSRRFLKMNLLPDQYDGADQDGASPSKDFRREERFDRLQQSISRLTQEQQEVIRLTRIEGQTIRQAAATMKRSETATYQLLWRATKRLKEAFGDTASLQLPPDRNLGPTS